MWQLKDFWPIITYELHGFRLMLKIMLHRSSLGAERRIDNLIKQIL